MYVSKSHIMQKASLWNIISTARYTKFHTVINSLVGYGFQQISVTCSLLILLSSSFWPSSYSGSKAIVMCYFSMLAPSVYVTGFEKTWLPHTISNLRFHQKWITGSIHYHIPLCTLLQSHECGFCGSFS